MKKCSTCKIPKEDIDFNWANKKLNKRSGRCRICANASNQRYADSHKRELEAKKQERVKRNKKVINKLKENSGCKDCGKFFNYWSLEFDHIIPENKSFDISLAVGNGWSINYILNEINKCDVVCSNCHRIRTFNMLRAKFGAQNKKNKKHIDGRMVYRKSGNLTIDIIKQEPCGDCGEKYHTACMDFDHIDASVKTYNISKMLHDQMALEKIMIEISQCDLVCANCHSTRTHIRRINGKKI